MRPGGDEPGSDLPSGLGKPARRALAGAGYMRLEQFAEVSEAEILRLHGMGPKALALICRALAARGQAFADDPRHPSRESRQALTSSRSDLGLRTSTRKEDAT